MWLISVRKSRLFNLLKVFWFLSREWPLTWDLKTGPLKGIDFISWHYRDQAGLVETNLDNYQTDYSCKQNHCCSLERRRISGAWWLKRIKTVKTESRTVDHGVSREFPSHSVLWYIKAQTLLSAAFSFIEISCRTHTSTPGYN